MSCFLLQVIFGTFLSFCSQGDSCCCKSGFYRVMQVLLGTILFTSHIIVSIHAICLLCHGCKRERCLLCLCFIFFGILVPSMQHSCHVLHAFCFYFWPSPGRVACLLFALHVCHASTVTAAFHYPLCFFLGWLHTQMVSVMSLLVFFWHISSVPAAFWVLYP